MADPLEKKLLEATENGEFFVLGKAEKEAKQHALREKRLEQFYGDEPRNPQNPDGPKLAEFDAWEVRPDNGPNPKFKMRKYGNTGVKGVLADYAEAVQRREQKYATPYWKEQAQAHSKSAFAPSAQTPNQILGISSTTQSPTTSKSTTTTQNSNQTFNHPTHFVVKQDSSKIGVGQDVLEDVIRELSEDDDSSDLLTESDEDSELNQELIAQWKEKRIAEINKSKQPNLPTYGYVRNLSAATYSQVIDSAHPNSLVLVHLWSGNVNDCIRLNEIWNELSLRAPVVLFCRAPSLISKIASGKLIDETSLPVVLAYRNQSLIIPPIVQFNKRVREDFAKRGIAQFRNDGYFDLNDVTLLLKKMGAWI